MSRFFFGQHPLVEKSPTADDLNTNHHIYINNGQSQILGNKSVFFNLSHPAEHFLEIIFYGTHRIPKKKPPRFDFRGGGGGCNKI